MSVSLGENNIQFLSLSLSLVLSLSLSLSLSLFLCEEGSRALYLQWERSRYSKPEYRRDNTLKAASDIFLQPNKSKNLMRGQFSMMAWSVSACSDWVSRKHKRSRLMHRRAMTPISSCFIFLGPNRSHAMSYHILTVLKSKSIKSKRRRSKGSDALLAWIARLLILTCTTCFTSPCESLAKTFACEWRSAKIQCYLLTIRCYSQGWS